MTVPGVRRGLVHRDCRDTTQAVADVEVTVPPEVFGSRDFDFGSRSAPFEGAATRKASGSAGGYLLKRFPVPAEHDSSDGIFTVYV